MGIVWIAAHSPQAKGRVERSFQTAQDRLVKGLRIAGVRTLEQANHYLQSEFLPWWNQHLVVAPSHPADAHRALGPDHHLAAILSQDETRQVDNDYTIQVHGQLYRIEPASRCAGLRGATVRIERRLDGSLAVRFRDRSLATGLYLDRPLPKPAAAQPPRAHRKPRPSPAMRAVIDRLFTEPGPPVWIAGQLDRTRTRDRLD